ncbi:MAG: DNA-binding response regulator, AraC family [Hydrogenibacillus schlegelii]|uniref:DNA-binding response regulator, AraC family n=1 Tax=Hydrogenibacillus schlegelii TaxID=1484 RepID=A0A2T5G9A9_HYDSH|nr:response regulator [Hydrogenibacillus schlegelii]PTQ52782.1 MAG: DNA-binding response regulator, AraC family [Hydrogenibacillus schlegelii]
MQRLRIAIVDDEPIERKALRTIIERSLPTLEVIGEAEDGATAIKLADRLQPDLMTVDVKMPGMDGLTAIRHIRARHPHIQFIIVSAYDTFAYAQQAIQLGVKDYLLKPSRRQVILEVLSRVAEEILLKKQEEKRLRWLEAEWRRMAELLKTDRLSPPAGGPSSEFNDPFRSAVALIEEQYAKPLSLTQVARAVGVNPFTLSRLFKLRTGLTFVEYLTHRRISEAKRLLMETDLPMKTIALSVGFRDPNYMSRVFRRVTGHPPSAYRSRPMTPEAPADPQPD